MEGTKGPKTPGRCLKIVLASSLSALGNRGQTDYAAARAGLHGMARIMAIKLGPFNVSVNAVAPGSLLTGVDQATFASRSCRSATLAVAT